MRPERGAAAPSFILIDEPGGPGLELALEGDEAHYLARVCRARAGERVTASDGRGTLAELELLEVARTVRARVLAVRRIERVREAELWCGAPEGERADWLIEKLAELGLSRVHLIDTARAGWKAGAARLARWRRLAEAALRQSRQAWRLEIVPPREMSEALRALAHPQGARWLADAQGSRAPAAPAGGSSLGAVGPAPGFDPNEREALIERGFQPMSLAVARLRTETAAIAWAAWWASGSTSEAGKAPRGPGA